MREVLGINISSPIVPIETGSPYHVRGPNQLTTMAAAAAAAATLISISNVGNGCKKSL